MEHRLNSPYSHWRLEDGRGSVLSIPNGIVGIRLKDGRFSCFNGRIAVNVPAHWLELVAHKIQIADAPIISDEKFAELVDRIRCHGGAWKVSSSDEGCFIEYEGEMHAISERQATVMFTSIPRKS